MRACLKTDADMPLWDARTFLCKRTSCVRACFCKRLSQCGGIKLCLLSIEWMNNNNSSEKATKELQCIDHHAIWEMHGVDWYRERSEREREKSGTLKAKRIEKPTCIHRCILEINHHYVLWSFETWQQQQTHNSNDPKQASKQQRTTKKSCREEEKRPFAGVSCDDCIFLLCVRCCFIVVSRTVCALAVLNLIKWHKCTM